MNTANMNTVSMSNDDVRAWEAMGWDVVDTLEGNGMKELAAALGQNLRMVGKLVGAEPKARQAVAQPATVAPVAVPAPVVDVFAAFRPAPAPVATVAVPTPPADPYAGLKAVMLASTSKADGGAVKSKGGRGKGDGLAEWRKLKAECEAKGLPSKGSKVQLRKRLEAHARGEAVAPIVKKVKRVKNSPTARKAKVRKMKGDKLAAAVKAHNRGRSRKSEWFIASDLSADQKRERLAAYARFGHSTPRVAAAAPGEGKHTSKASKSNKMTDKQKLNAVRETLAQLVAVLA